MMDFVLNLYSILYTIKCLKSIHVLNYLVFSLVDGGGGIKSIK